MLISDDEYKVMRGKYKGTVRKRPKGKRYVVVDAGVPISKVNTLTNILIIPRFKSVGSARNFVRRNRLKGVKIVKYPF